jgi:hypothetical protein
LFRMDSSIKSITRGYIFCLSLSLCLSHHAAFQPGLFSWSQTPTISVVHSERLSHTLNTRHKVTFLEERSPSTPDVQLSVTCALVNRPQAERVSSADTLRMRGCRTNQGKIQSNHTRCHGTRALYHQLIEIKQKFKLPCDGTAQLSALMTVPHRHDIFPSKEFN